MTGRSTSASTATLGCLWQSLSWDRCLLTLGAEIRRSCRRWRT
ncbi:hypothetical protein L345_13896, partial [Ophiophagus hannah]